MKARHFDALVVGSGPAGGIAATVLARGGARVALVDKSDFPRDKACGDLIGPRGVAVLTDLGISIPNALRGVGDMMFVGPTDRRVRLPCFPGRTYPGYALAVPRHHFDALLHETATAAGAESFADRATEPLWTDGNLEGFTLSKGTELRGDVVIGADGATSRVASAAGLVDSSQALWAFALRAYVDERVELPYIVVWDRAPWRGLPGYGWLFPGPDGRGNLGLGVGTLNTRSGAALAARELPAFASTLRERGLIGDTGLGPTLGGWLKLGMVGTVPARGRVLLSGDAAGLVNPLQGEGIAQALMSGRAAAQAVLAGPAGASRRYRQYLTRAYLPYHAVTAPIHAAMLSRPRVVSAVARLLTAPGLGSLLAPTWSIFWNDLVDGARPSTPRELAALSRRIGRAATRRGRMREWFTASLEAPERRDAPPTS